jgi:proteasome assembly chaperone (PAC2) family protein
VGKLAVDFLVDTLKAKKIVDFRSHNLPHSVFVNEKGLVELPRIELHMVERKKGPSLLLLSGDVQPVDEASCYDFCELVVRLCKELGVSRVLTTGGIGLKSVPKKPKVYVAGTSKDAVKPFAKLKVSTDLYGTVGPIIGVSGVLCGVAGREGIPAAALLVEVFGHPMYLGVRGAKELLRVINADLKLSLNMKEIEKEIQTLEDELTEKTKDMAPIPGKGDEMNYIG